MGRRIYLFFILHSAFLGLAHEAIDDEPTLGGKSLGSWVIQLKTSQKPDERKEAAFAIMLFGEPAASIVPELIAALDDPDEEVQDYAIGALAGLGGLASKAVPTLIARLGDDRLNGGGWDLLHHSIFEALAAIGEPAVPDLIGVLESNDVDVRWRATEALRMIGPDAKRATESLSRHLDDPNETVALNCAQALQAIGPEAKAAIPTLSALLQKTNISLKDEAEMPNRRYQSLVGALAALGADPDPALIRELENDRPRRFTALLLIAEYGPRAKFLATQVERLLADTDEDIRAEAADVLCKIDPPGSFVINRSIAALSSPDPKLRVDAARFLSGIGPQAKGAMPALTLALKDPDRDVREQVALVISEIDPTVPAAVEILTEAFRRLSKDNRFLADQTSRALGQFGPLARGAIPVLSEYLKEPPPFGSSASSTLEALNWIDPPGESIAHALAGALGTDDKKSRLDFLRLLANLGRHAVAEVPAVVKMLKHEDEETRREAAHVLGRIGSGARAAVPDLMALLGDDAPNVRSEAIESLGQIGFGDSDAPFGLIDELRRGANSGQLSSIVALIHLDPPFRTTAAKLAQASEDLYFRAIIEGALGHETLEGQGFVRRTIRDLDRVLIQDHIPALVTQDFVRPEIRELDPDLKTKRGLESDPGVPNPLILALDYITDFGAGAKSALPWVARARKNTDPRVRRAADFAFDQIQKSLSKTEPR